MIGRQHSSITAGSGFLRDGTEAIANILPVTAVPEDPLSVYASNDGEQWNSCADASASRDETELEDLCLRSNL